MRLAWVTCAGLPAWEVDDAPLFVALAARGIDAERVPWDADVDWSAFDGALVRTTWDYWDRVDDFLAWTRRAAAATRLWPEPDVIAWNVHKSYLLALAARGVPLAPTEVLSPGDGRRVAGIARRQGWTRGFLKPIVGGSASGTLRFEADVTGLVAAAAHVDGADRPMLLQPYLADVEATGEISVVMVEGRVTHAVRKVPVPGDFRVQDDWGASDEPWPVDDALARLALDVVDAARACLGRAEPFLQARVDLLRHQGRVVLVELELVEPSLFFRHGPHAADRLAEALEHRLRAPNGQGGRHG